MLPDRLRNTGPQGGVVAILAARRTMRGRSSRRCGSKAHFTSGCATGTSGSYSIGSCRPWPISYWPAVTISGEPAKRALYSAPIACPSPGMQCRLQAASRPDARAKPSAIATATDSCSPST
jgi:hypothetical protein